MRRRYLAAAALAAGLSLLAACGGDDGSVTRENGASSGSGAGGSGSGLSASDLGTQSNDPELTTAVTAYRGYVAGQVAKLRAETKTFTDAVRAGKLAEAQAAYAPSRYSWEAIEPIAGLVESIDGAVDSRVDDFANESDPKWTGWHRLEYLLWEKKTTDGGKPFADQLDKDLGTLQTELPKIDITPKAVALGAGELVEEVSKGKITGEEDRYSHTDLWDFAANVEGAKMAYQVFAARLQSKDATLKTTLEANFAAVEKSIGAYRTADGYKPFTALTAADKKTMTAQLATLSESLAKLPAALGVG